MAGRGSGDSPMRCPTGELKGFPRRKSIAAAATATNPWYQLTATASSADPSRDVSEGPRGGAGGGGAEGAWNLTTGPAPDVVANPPSVDVRTTQGCRESRGVGLFKPRPKFFKGQGRGLTIS